MHASGLSNIRKNKTQNIKELLFVVRFYSNEHVLGFIDLFWQLRVVFYVFLQAVGTFTRFCGFWNIILDQNRLFSGKNNFHRNRVRDLQPIQDAEWIFRNRRQEKKVGHDNKLLRNYVGQHFERRGQFYYPLDRSFKSVAVAQ